MDLTEWLSCARADAERRDLADLIPILQGLVRAGEALRSASWNADARDPITNREDDAS